MDSNAAAGVTTISAVQCRIRRIHRCDLNSVRRACLLLVQCAEQMAGMLIYGYWREEAWITAVTVRSVPGGSLEPEPHKPQQAAPGRCETVNLLGLADIAGVAVSADLPLSVCPVCRLHWLRSLIANHHIVRTGLQHRTVTFRVDQNSLRRRGNE